MDNYVSQDILAYLDNDTRVIVKTICHSWNANIQVCDFGENGLKRGFDVMNLACQLRSTRLLYIYDKLMY